jgi:ADP-heptose:LPS heptosyltransferase
LSAIRRQYPKAEFTLLTTPGRRGLPGAKDVFESVAWIDRILEYYPEEVFTLRGAISFLSLLRRYRFDIFFELPNDMAGMALLLRNMLFARLVGAKWADGWALNTLRIALPRQSEHIEFPNEVERLFQLVERGSMQESEIEFSLPIADETIERAKAMLEGQGIYAQGKIVALGHGAKRPGNRWPAERFAEVGQRLARRGYQVVLLGTKDEWSVAEAIREHIGVRSVNLAGATSVLEAAAILRHCSLLICNDSGLQHLASAVDTPCVAIFSYWQLRGKWWPHQRDAVVLQKMVPCHTCYLHDCPVGDRCVTDITCTEVIAAAFGILGEDVTSGQFDPRTLLSISPIT